MNALAWAIGGTRGLNGKSRKNGTGQSGFMVMDGCIFSFLFYGNFFVRLHEGDG